MRSRHINVPTLLLKLKYDAWWFSRRIQPKLIVGTLLYILLLYVIQNVYTIVIE